MIFISKVPYCLINLRDFVRNLSGLYYIGKPVEIPQNMGRFAGNCLSLRKSLAHWDAGFFQVVIVHNLLTELGAHMWHKRHRDLADLGLPSFPPIQQNVLQQHTRVHPQGIGDGTEGLQSGCFCAALDGVDVLRSASNGFGKCQLGHAPFFRAVRIRSPMALVFMIISSLCLFTTIYMWFRQQKVTVFSKCAKS